MAWQDGTILTCTDGDICAASSATVRGMSQDQVMRFRRTT
jgi:hypothetical protein